jgi:pimeloyl-ACP methyl ester carboxylesterase
MFPGDPAKEPARRKFVATMRDVFGVEQSNCHEIPYEGRKLFAYRFTPPFARSTIVACGGFDGHIEEFFPGFLYLREAGYDVVAFEGPGQGATLEEGKLPLSPIWHRPVAAVLNHFQLTDVTLLGLSLGGCLMLRAAAHERRAKRVVCDDILPDFYGAILRQLTIRQRLGLRVLMAGKAYPLVNAMIAAIMATSLVVEWGMKQGMLVTGTATPYEFLCASMRYETRSVSSMVEQDVLLLAGAEDHYVPFEQLSEQIRGLTKPRSLTARVFTRQEKAQNHVQRGNVGLSLDVIVRWLEGLEERDRCLHPA